MDLKMLTKQTGYFEGSVVVGVFLTDRNTAILIDSGSDDSAARKYANYLENRNVKLEAIINTHSHADHCGGNGLLQKRTQCKVFAVGLEAPLIRDPYFEPICFYGAAPPDALCNKFLKAEETPEVQRVSFGALDIDGITFGLEDFSGHSPNMTGVRTPDNILFSGDALISPQIAEKHKILYNFNLTQTIQILKAVPKIQAERWVLSHGGECQEPQRVAEDNLNRLEKVNELLLDILKTSMSREAALEQLLDRFALKLPMALYYLNLGIVSSHLTYLCQQKRVEAEMQGCKLRYKALSNA